MAKNRVLERLNLITEKELRWIKVRNDSNNIILYLDDCKIALDTNDGFVSLIDKTNNQVELFVKDINTFYKFTEILNQVIINDKVDDDILKKYTYKIIFNINLNIIKNFKTEIDVYGNFLIKIGDNLDIRTKDKVVVIHINNNRYSFIDEVISMKIRLIVLRCLFKSKTDTFIDDINNIKELMFDIDK